LPLLSGACLFPFDLHRQGLQKLAPWLIAQKITYVSFSGSLLRAWLASLSDDLRFPALRFVRATGERLYAQDVIRMSRHLAGDWRIGHSYSSGEAGTIAAQIFTASRLPEPGIVAVGRPVDGVEVFIQDERGALVAPGEIGEVVVRSRFLARGYWNNPDLSAKVFQTDPLDSAIRIYRTGDLGRRRSDGTLEHVGRKGRTIRLRGYNVEPFQVECELMRQPNVADAVVLLYDSAAGEEPSLVGYVVAPTNASPSAIRAGLAERLPSYMVPSHIVVLDSFPIASSGKIDLNALPPPRREQPHLVPFRTPTDEREHELCTIWKEVLKLPKIGIDDDFFELGGTSLQALTVFAKIEARLGCSLSPSTIIQAPTIARLAEFIRATTGTSLVPLRTSGTGLPLFLVTPGYYGVMQCRHLVSHLKSDRPVFGLQPLPLDGKHRIPRTIESMAADYITEIRRVQPHGPYFIAGHCYGGRVSFEIAQQLVREGERVSFLGLIDTVFHRASVQASPLLSEAVRLSGKVRDVEGFQDLLARGRIFIKWRVWCRLLDLWFRQGRAIPHAHRVSYYGWICHRAKLHYAAKPYTGHITMFSSTGNSQRQRAYWGPLASGGLTVLEVPAGHADIVLPPHSKLLAEYFDACLDVTAQGV
jgi:thioesterase domain-containing protein/acyl carrier protein